MQIIIKETSQELNKYNMQHKNTDGVIFFKNPNVNANDLV